MSDVDRRAFVGAAALGGVAAAVLTSSSAEAAGDNSGYFVVAEIVSTKEKADEVRALLVPYAEKSAQGTGVFEIRADGSHSRARSLPDLRAMDEQSGPRCPHGH